MGFRSPFEGVNTGDAPTVAIVAEKTYFINTRRLAGTGRGENVRAWPLGKRLVGFPTGKIPRLRAV
jgi:hypothetical protein